MAVTRAQLVSDYRDCPSAPAIIETFGLDARLEPPFAVAARCTFRGGRSSNPSQADHAMEGDRLQLESVTDFSRSLQLERHGVHY